MWYKLGKVKSASEADKLIGQDTNWEYAGIKPGDIFLLEDYPPLEILSVEDNTHLTLDAEVGISSWVNYKIIRVHSATSHAETTADLADLLRRIRKLFNEEINTLQGMSAYELAQENGFTGTLEEWLESLKGGPKGDPGTNGMSAFEIAKENGFSGTVTAWLASLKGQEGKSSYELACEKGFEGTLSEYLESLHGADGENGKDGVDGENGLSSYEIAVANGFIGSQLAWLESLRADCRYCPHYHHGYFHHLPCPPAEGEEPSEGEVPSHPPLPPKPPIGHITNNIYVTDPSKTSSSSSEIWDGGDLDDKTKDEPVEGGDLDDTTPTTPTTPTSPTTPAEDEEVDAGDLDP